MPVQKLLAKIHIAKKELGLADEIYRDILHTKFGVETSRDISNDQALRLIRHFKDLGWIPKSKPKKYDDQKGDFYSATPGQKRKIEVLWHNIYRGNEETKHLRQFLFNHFKVSDIRFLDKSTAHDVIEGLKQMQKRRAHIAEGIASMSKKKYFPTEEELRIIRDLYDGRTIATNKIMRVLGHKYPRWYVKRIAQEMGLARLAKQSNWSDREIEYLHKYFPKKGFMAIQNGLKKINGGTLRSITAIVLKKKREGINKRSDGFTMRMVEDILGADHHKIERWVHNGWLKDARKGTNRLPVQGGDMHHFEAENLRSFVINYPEQIDIRRVEKGFFIHLLAGLL